MSKKFIAIILSIVLTSFNFYGIYYSFASESTIDLLIENNQKQKELQDKISQIEYEIQSKKEINKNLYINSDDDIEVITVSFVKTDIEYDEIDQLEATKNILNEKLEEKIIEGVQIEKILEEHSLNEVKNTDKNFIVGIWPLKDYTYISSPYGYRIHPISNIRSFHKGIDIPAPQDTDILSIDNGIVIFSGYQNGYGNVVKIKHFDGKISIYAHNNSLLVSKGDVIKQGQVIAKVGSTGNSTGNHVHFEIIVNNENINPVDGIIK